MQNNSFYKRTTGDIVAEILMSRSYENYAIMLVEGDEDYKFWRKFTYNNKNCIIIKACAKINVVRVIEFVNLNKYNGILGIIDRDYDCLLGVNYENHNLFYIDGVNIESMLMDSETLNRVIYEVGDENKIKSHEKEQSCDVLKYVESIARYFGLLRCVNLKMNYNLDCQKISPWKYVDEERWRLDKNRLIYEYLLLIKNILSRDDLITIMNEVQKLCTDIVNGKDALTIICIGLRYKIGSVQISLKHLCEMLRIAYSIDRLTATSVYVKIMDWQQRSSSYSFLKRD